MDDDERQDKLQELLKYYNVFLNLYPVLNSKDKLIELKVADRPQEEVNIVTEKGNVLQVNLSEDREADNDVNISIEVSEIIVHAEDIEEVEDIINSDIFGDTDNFDISDDFEEFNDIDNFICLDINDNNYTVFPNFFFEKIKMFNVSGLPRAPTISKFSYQHRCPVISVIYLSCILKIIVSRE
ncbi:hypothetical protein POVWA2_004810 [Plasmodium ovale wallikeri]|uniref:Uncharacterized protein n=1 Tax=Plasmodium ovale wallikeri TaxID=864142 RepID=A0A1A8YHE0_PLAOA|nr:hypothetical protein POVWA1_004750 [Plasmodium ovale wallikeri]SBT31557.1 hypothetical protein POVWA2_004810 [Plasmodium ovale wallikeri]